MKISKRISTVLLTGVLVASIVACGAKSSRGVTDQAGTRGIDEGQGVYYFDDAAIATAKQAASSTIPAECLAVLNMMNSARVASGLKELTWNTALENAAHVRASEASVKWSHTRPNGSAFWTVDSNVQYGENLAKGYTTAESAYNAWMASPTHKDNIMFADYRTVAIAIYQADNGDWYWAEEFGY